MNLVDSFMHSVVLHTITLDASFDEASLPATIFNDTDGIFSIQHTVCPR
jgi:hypothetical protein